MATKPASEKPSASKPLFIVGIGASAGGLEALQDLFDHLPPSSHLAYVVVQHLSPDYKSLMVELLSKRTRMNVFQIKDGVQIEANTIYVMSAKNDLSIREGCLYLVKRDDTQNIHFPIDLFFQALGEDQGEQAIGVILSGTGTDGTRGLKIIKEKGGVILVQEPGTAKFNGMPVSAISTNLVDQVLSPARIAERLLFLVDFQQRQKGLEGSMIDLNASSLNGILGLIRELTGIDFSQYKKNTLFRRLERRRVLQKIPDLDQFFHHLQSHPDEVMALQQDLLIGVTQFFRDTEAYEVIRETVIPGLFDGKEPEEVIRVWVAGCSTGEEAYSLMILLMEHKEKHQLPNPIKIFATDIDGQAIDFAGLGEYPVNIAIDVPAKILEKYFVQKDKKYVISPNLRNHIVFARHNVLADPPFNRVDLITCRNLLIYLEAPLQKRVISIFQFALVKNGYMVLGPSESMNDQDRYFSVINKRWKVFRSKVESRLVIPEVLGNLNLAEREKYHTSRRPYVSSLEEFKTHDFDKLRQEIVDRFSPMAVFIDRQFQVILLTGGANRLIRLPENRMSLNLQKMVPAELGVPIGTAVHKAIKSGEKVRYPGVRFQLEETERAVDLMVEVIAEKTFGEEIILLTFEERAVAEKSDDFTILSRENTERVKFLEQQLEDTRETLQTTIEELETSNEELQASNEELMAANEELQSTNEELQSVNEELHTVNSELESKINEMTELADDMDNLLNSIAIGTIFLDNDLRIRKYTPGIQAVFNFMPQDIGRPLEHFNTDLGIDNIANVARKVLRSLNAFQKTIRLSDDRIYLLRILPYLTDSVRRENGVVIVFVNIDSLTQDLPEEKE
ncbi:MAG: chemotaxis protein CheB [Bacteroidota bacterium]